MFPQIFALDWTFQERATRGPSEATQQALGRFWSRPEVAGLVPELELPHDDWQAILSCLERLSDAELQHDRMQPWTPMPEPSEHPWAEVARLAEQLARDDPVAGSIAALYATAAWEGALGEHLYAQPWSGHHWGWHVFPLVLGRTLLAADAVWTARSVVDLATGFVEKAKGFPVNEALTMFLAEYADVAHGAERRLATCVANLAWDLRGSLDANGPNFRPEVGAMLWTLGDVPHAERLASDAAYVPPLALVRDVVELSMSRLATDPFLQYVWLELKDRPPFDLRSHKVLFTAINHVYHRTGVHEVEDMGVFSPSRAYAQTAIEHFGGAVSPARATEFEAEFAMFQEFVGTREPLELLRLGALFNLALPRDEATRRERWVELTEFAAEIMRRTVRRGVFQPLNNCLDIPFYYLVSSDGEPTAAIDAVERYRCGALAYWLAITTPAPPDGDAATGLLEEERDLLMELRGARFIRLLPHLPAHYQRYGFEVREALDEPIPEGATELEGERGILRFDPFDQDLAKRELDDAWERLESLWERMRDVASSYADERVEPFASVQEFQRALRPVP